MAKTKTTTKRRTQSKPEPTPEDDVSMCRRRGERRDEDEKDEDEKDEATPVKSERRKVQRRRQIDPTTCERDYTPDEIEFMHALDDYKRASGRMFPTCSEILEVVRNLGYLKVTDGVKSAEVVESPPDSEEVIDPEATDPEATLESSEIL